LILLGLFKKVAIADPVSGIANRAFSTYSHAGSLELLIGMVAFAIQIYGDFSGYTDIARGVSRLFGIELVRNFEQPYLSRNITEFWRCWHMSLSSWLHDYLYVPLGGNRNGRLQTYRNLMVTMLLGGLWHGASWTFVVWGGLHGSMLSVHRAMGGYVPRGDVKKIRWRNVPGILFTFTCVSLAWIFFRAQDFSQAAGYLAGLFSFRPGPVAANDVILLVVSAILMLAVDLSQRQSGLHAPVLRWTPVARGAAYALLVLVLVTWIGSEARPFIYFQF
jgi:D-alanyl-lipoteichoic acid acyltransferase DltB (MBOAT superfamily)